MSSLQPDLGRCLGAAVEAARAAQRILLAETHRSGGPRQPRGHCPADTAAEEAIRRILYESMPAFGYRGEETGTAHLASDYLWIVDPNDGTEAMQDGFRGHSVSIALLDHRRRPVLGVVLAVNAPDDEGDLFAWALGCGPLTHNGQPAPPRVWPDRLAGNVIVALSQQSDRHPTGNAAAVAPARFRDVASIAYRLALAAVGDVDAAVSLNSRGSVDYAGGHALVVAQGGRFVDESGNEISYDRQGRSYVRHCFGGAPNIVLELARRQWSTVAGSGFGPAAPPRGYEPARLKPGSHVADTGVLRRAHGCLIGQIAGDALGSLVEFQSAREIADGYPDGRPYQLADGGTWNTIAGQPTDDSELALSLARTLVAQDGFSLASVLGAYKQWKESGPFDIGGTTSSGLDGRPSHSSQANGALMRISPLGIWGWKEDAAVVADAARQDAALTHPNPICQEASAVFAVTLATIIREGLDSAAAYAFARDWALKHCREPLVTETIQMSAAGPAVDHAQAGWVIVALQLAFFHLSAVHPVNLALIDIVRRGGDTDTNAAIAGALLGSVHGRASIPMQWTRSVLSCRPLPGLNGVHRPRPATYWPADAFVLAERLLLVNRVAI